MPARSRQARGQRRCRRRRDRWRRRGRRSRRRSARARLHHREGPLDARRTRHPAGDARGRRLRALRPGCRRAQVGGGLRRLDARLRSVDVRAGRRALAGVRPPRDGRRGDEPLRPARHRPQRDSRRARVARGRLRCERPPHRGRVGHHRTARDDRQARAGDAGPRGERPRREDGEDPRRTAGVRRLLHCRHRPGHRAHASRTLRHRRGRDDRAGGRPTGGRRGRPGDRRAHP